MSALSVEENNEIKTIGGCLLVSQIGICDILWKGTEHISQLVFKLFKISKYSCQEKRIEGGWGVFLAF